MTGLTHPGRGSSAIPGRDDRRPETSVTSKRAAIGAIGAQGAQALASFTIQVIVAKTLGFHGLGAFAILYGAMQIVSGVTSGFVGDSLTVLDRQDRRIRAALQSYALVLPLAAAVLCAAISWAAGLTTIWESVAAGAAMALFAFEELIRRLHMASMAFWRVVAIDIIAFAGALVSIALFWRLGELSLLAFLVAVGAGQALALIVGAVMLPRAERRLVPLVGGGFRPVFAYGFWRACQQVLRPTMLTIMRVMVTAAATLAATGMIEAARTYVAPVTLMVTGLGSYLFVRFANDKAASAAGKLRAADRAVFVLIALTAVIGAIMVALLPWLSTLLFDAPLDVVSVIGWVVFSTSIAAVSPYCALASTQGRQSAVFAIRSLDTLLALALAWLALAVGAAPALVPLLIAVAPAIGGIAVRAILLVPMARRSRAGAHAATAVVS